MPIYLKPDQARISQQGEGWVEYTLADSQIIGSPAMVARRWSLKAKARRLFETHREVEQLLYVIRGDGEAAIEDERLPLEPETVLWLEPGDCFQIIAGDEGLEILQGFAPGE